MIYDKRPLRNSTKKHMSIKLYTDEHVVPAVVNALRKQGLDILTAQEAQMLNAPDEEHLRFAISQGRSIFTQDADFLRLHARQIKHRGIIYTHQKTPTKQIIEGLILIHQALTEEEMQDHIEFL